MSCGGDVGRWRAYQCLQVYAVVDVKRIIYECLWLSTMSKRRRSMNGHTWRDVIPYNLKNSSVESKTLPLRGPTPSLRDIQLNWHLSRRLVHSGKHSRTRHTVCRRDVDAGDMIHDRWASPEEAGGSLVGGSQVGGYIFERAKGVLMCPMMPQARRPCGQHWRLQGPPRDRTCRPETAGAAPFSGRARAACDTV